MIGCWIASEPWTTSRAQADARDEAHRHYEAGVLAFDELRFADSAAEFEQAYALAPAWQVLYNLGTVYAALGRPLQAIDAFGHYLEQADSSIGPERRQQVQAEIAKQRAKTGLLEIRVDATRAAIRVDGRPVGRSPLPEPIRLAAGSHRVDVEREGFRAQTRQAVAVGANQRRVLELSLLPLAQSSAAGFEATPLAAADIPAPPKPDSDPGAVQRIAGFSLGGAGLVGVATGAIVAGLGQGKHNDAVDLAYRGQWPEARSLEAEADRQKTLGFVTLGVGSAFVVAGVILVLLAPDAEPVAPRLRVSGWAATGSAGVVMHRSW